MSLSQLTYVTWLDLRYNLLVGLPYEIDALVSLQVLLLQGNRLTCLPTSLGECGEGGREGSRGVRERREEEEEEEG